MKRVCMYVVLLLLVTASQALGAVSVSLQSSYLSHVDELEVVALNASVPQETGIHSLGFLGTVGGAAFFQTARPKEDWLGQTVSLSYHPEEPDGRRVRVQIGSEQVTAPLYDWELVPIAAFAESTNQAAVSLFGTTIPPALQAGSETELSGARLRESVLRLAHQVRYLVAYHPAFQNSLLGVRLLQMDSAVFARDEVFADIPTDATGQPVLGAGERAPMEWDEEEAEDLIRKLDELRHRYDYDSYVITDQSVDIWFDVDGGELKLGGEPYIWFWRRKDISTEVIPALQEYAAAEFGVEVTLAVGSGETLELKQSTGSEAAVTAFAEWFHSDTLKDWLDANMAAHAAELSQAIDNLRTPDGTSVWQTVNPLVYAASRTVMQYAAFFRYCQQQMPEQDWQDFAAAVSAVEAEPVVTNPNVMKHLPYRHRQGELAVTLEWSGPYDLDLQIWSDELEPIGAAYHFHISPDIRHGGDGAERFVFRAYPGWDFSTGTYIVSPFFAGPRTDASVTAVLTVYFPDESSQVLTRDLQFRSPYDQWFALAVDADSGEVTVLDYFDD